MKELLTLLALLPLLCGAQELKSTGTSVDYIVPEGWWHTESVGDLNKDGVADLALIALPNDSAHIKVRDDGYAYNFNQPLLAIYFGTDGGRFRLWKTYDEVMPATVDEYTMIDYAINITPRGTMTIGIEAFMTMGSYGSPNVTYVFRFQDGDFYLIGEEQHSLSRMSGEDETISYNYLTHKRQQVVSNAFDDSIKPREKWTTIPKGPLKRLGTWSLDY
ncbi:MAG: FG-GAP repeat protein [Prevotella sp.]|nr:FG-GAP repeat protein [Prevotella sp.]